MLSKKASLITLNSCLTCINTIHSVFGKSDQLNIKWPNDIYLNNSKKLAGIKAYSEISGNTFFCNVGIGMNFDNNIAEIDPKFASMKDLVNFSHYNISKKEFTEELVGNLHENIFNKFGVENVDKIVEDCNN